MNQGNPPTGLAPEPSGQGREVGWFKQIIKNIRERTVRGGPGIRVSYTTNGTLVELAKVSESAGATESAGIRRCVIAATHDNYLDVTAFTDNGGNSEAMKVVIPKYLRASTYVNLALGGYHYFTSGGQIRVSSGGDDTKYIVKALFPPYEINQEIYALQPIGKTDVTIAGEVLEWIDANVDGRHMDTAQVELPMCRLEGGAVVPRHVVVEGGPIY